MATHAAGKRAQAMCDRCGFLYPYRSMRTEIIAERPTGNRVCRECYDPDHPQLKRKKRHDDPQALRYPRPEKHITPASYVLAGVTYVNVTPGDARVVHTGGVILNADWQNFVGSL